MLCIPPFIKDAREIAPRSEVSQICKDGLNCTICLFFSPAEKEQLERMIHTMNSVAPPAVSAGRSNSRAYRYKMAVPPADKQTKRPDWVSNWTGPM